MKEEGRRALKTRFNSYFAPKRALGKNRGLSTLQTNCKNQIGYKVKVALNYLELAEKEAIASIAATEFEKYKLYLMVSKFNQVFREQVQSF